MNRENGFSLIELLLVVVIVGILSALAIPAMQKGLRAAELGSIVATLRSVSSTQASFFSQNNRFGRISEINSVMGGAVGATAGDKVIRGQYVFEMSPASPTNEELKNEFTLTVTRSVPDDIIYKFELTHTGEVVQVLP
ncbi:MAG: prepilin-type N-terminal cleavage/methylation domain-containing protein [Pyrinomonadaceae bacterium]|nr:prepilin-type N-terminal cleavage/methylation domain-containing protein [Pyrinomonadaceae bacterium]